MSSLTSHFGTNYAPTDDELVEIRNLLTPPTARLAELDAEMARKLAEYEALRQQHTMLSLELADYRALAALVRRLPVDIFREIFLHCLPTEHNAIFSYKEAPMLLTRVCSAWRTIALTTPALWASMHVPVLPIDISWSEARRAKMQKDRLVIMRERAREVEEWLTRSGACGLSISLYEQGCSNDRLNSNYDKFLDMIIPHSMRWRSMRFEASADYITRIAALSAEDVPALEEITVNMTSFVRHIVGDDPGNTVVKWTNSSFLGAPRLHRVSFRNLDEDIHGLPLRWQQLTHISLTGATICEPSMSISNTVQLLMKCPRLISATLEIPYCDPTLLVNSHPNIGTVTRLSQSMCTSSIVLSDLVDLSLHNSGQDLSAFFAILDVPRLITLEYIDDRAAVQPVGELIALLGRVSGTLVSLTTDAEMYTRQDFLAILKAARRLKTFSNTCGRPMRSHNLWTYQGYYVHHFDDIFLGMLVGRRLNSAGKLPWQLIPEGRWVEEPEKIIEDYRQILLPELENLDLRISVGFTEEGLLQFLELRQNPAQGAEDAGTSTPSHAPYTRLKYCSIDFPREKTQPMFEEIEEYRKEGLALHLTYLLTKSRDPYSPGEGIGSSKTFLSLK